MLERSDLPFARIDVAARAAEIEDVARLDLEEASLTYATGAPFGEAPAPSGVTRNRFAPGRTS